MAQTKSERRYYNALKKLEGSKRGDYKEIKDFTEKLLSEGLSYGRAEKYIYHLKTAVDSFGLDLIKTNTAGLRKVVRQIEASDLEPKTKIGHKQALKRFYLEKNNGVDVSWINTTLKKKDRKRLPKILSGVNLKLVWKAVSKDIMEQALIGILEELGPRPEEVQRLTLGDIQPDKDGCLVNIRYGKTGARRLRIVKNSVAVIRWIDNHPWKDNQNAPLWVYFKGSNVYPLTSIDKRISRIGERAGLPFHLSVYHFRHTCATEKAGWMTEAQMRIFFGWELDSTMPAVYVHLSGRDVDKSLLKHYGLVEEEEGVTLRRCPRCQSINEEAAKYCNRCGNPLTLQVALEVEEVKARLADEVQVKKGLEIKIEMLERMMTEMQAMRRELEEIKAKG